MHVSLWRLLKHVRLLIWHLHTPHIQRFSVCFSALLICSHARLGQVRLDQVRLGQVRLGQVRLGQVRLGEVRLGQVTKTEPLGIIGVDNRVKAVKETTHQLPSMF